MLKPDLASALIGLGNALKDAGQLDGAIAAYRQAVSHHPGYAATYSNLGLALTERGNLDEAIAACRQAIALDPDFPDAHNNLGGALKAAGRVDEAIAACRRTLSLKPDWPEAHGDLGTALEAGGHFDEAVAAYRKAVALKPNWAEFRRNLALVLLMRGEFKQGWEEYEWRHRCRDRLPFRTFAPPQWAGEPLAGRSILLHAEQGFGDTLQFIRYVPLIAARGGKIFVECPGELHGLLRTMASQFQFVARDEPMAFDYHCSLVSLPRVFATTPDSIPRAVPYVHADAEAAGRWRDRLAGDANGIKAGLVWAGNKAHKNDRNRSIALSAFAPMGRLRGVSFYSLQKGEQSAEAGNPPAGLELIDWTNDLHDFNDTAALIANLDVVITVDTSVAHLAGSMGRPAWVLLPYVPDWRWLLDRQDSPWYPTIRLFRQPSFGDWHSVMRKVADALAALSASR